MMLPVPHGILNLGPRRNVILKIAAGPVPVPLRRPDPDIVLNVGRAIHHIYTSARYERRIDYGAAPPSPPLTLEDHAWLNAHLHGLDRR